MSPTPFPKQPYEEFPIAINYKGKLPFGAQLVSGTVSALDLSNNSDASTIVLGSTTATIDTAESLAKVIVRQGTDGKRYKITFRVVLSDTSKLEDEVIMEVAEI